MDLHQCDDVFSDTQLHILKSIGQAADAVGERCYLVGGAVRDCLLGNGNKDLDLVCSHSEKIVDQLARQKQLDLNDKGEPKFAKFPKFGTFQVRMNDEEVEFVNPRKETYIYQSHKPVVEGGTFADDAMRRDFTLNTLFLGIQSDDWMQVKDFTGSGLEDLKKGILKTPLDPDTTFVDDPSRLFRLARFKACKGFDIDDDTLQSARRNAHEVNEMVNVNINGNSIIRERVPRESVKQMMDKGIICDGYIDTLDDIGVLREIIPEINDMKGCEQSKKHHLYDVWNHTLSVIRELPTTKELKWAGLFHDMGKPRVNEDGTFHGHEKESEKMANDIMTRLKFSNDDVRRISHVVRNHMWLINLIGQMHDEFGKGVSSKAIRRFAVKNDGYESDLLDFAYADTKASGIHWKEDWEKLDVIDERLREVQEQLNMSSGRKFQLSVNGHDIMETMNIRPGPVVGKLQRHLTDKIMEGELLNDRDDLIEYLRGL